MKVTVLNDVNQATAPAFDQLLSTWKSAHPGADVDWIRPQGAVSLAAMVTAGTPPDVFSLGQDDFAAYAGSGEELALDDYIKRDHFDSAGYFSASVEMARQKGKQFGFPRAFNCGILYTNLSAFDQAGVPQPPLQWGAAKWGWAEFQDAAKRLSVPADDPQQIKFGADLLGGMGFFWSFVWANGGELFNADVTATRLNEPPAVQALQFIADLIHRYQANPKPDVKSALGDRTMFNNGQAMMQYIGASTRRSASLRGTGARFHRAAPARPTGAAATCGPSHPNPSSVRKAGACSRTSSAMTPKPHWPRITFPPVRRRRRRSSTLRPRPATPRRIAR